MKCTVEEKTLDLDELLEVPTPQYQLYALSQANYSISIHKSIDNIADLWESTAPRNTFYSAKFLRLIEQHPPVSLTPYYLIVWDGHLAIGVIYLQKKNFRLDESLNMDIPDDASAWQRLKRTVKRQLSKLIRSRIIVCGNVLLTGEYGYYINPDVLPHPGSLQLVEESICLFLKTQFGWLGRYVPILMKDFYAERSIADTDIRTSFTEFSIQPNMIMALDPEWQSMKDYLGAMKSKYRVRAKSAFKKLKNVDKRLLSKRDIAEYNDIMYNLYRQAADDAGFNLFYLPEDYFIEIKNHLDDQIDMYGYFLDGKMISYYTLVHGERYMEAHYIGFDRQLNRPMKIYLNMLYDIVKAGIEARAPKIQFARTALEIKSSVGAEAYDMQCLVKHTFWPINVMARPILNYFVPEEKWQPRSPFK